MEGTKADETCRTTGALRLRDFIDRWYRWVTPARRDSSAPVKQGMSGCREETTLIDRKIEPGTTKVNCATSIMPIEIAGQSARYAPLLGCILLLSCASAGSGSRAASTVSPPPPLDRPAVADGAIEIEPVEGPADTTRFHLGSPLFLRIRIGGERACQPFNGQPFFFDETGAQLGWGFEEVTDTLLFPRLGSCERIIMLSSENSNRLAEGRYGLRIALYLDERNRMTSNLIGIHAVRSTSGASESSYARFLQEQIVRKSPLLLDPETQSALFSGDVPASAESEVYRAVILYRSGNLPAAHAALQSASTMVERRRQPLSIAAARSAYALDQKLRAQGMGGSQ